MTFSIILCLTAGLYLLYGLIHFVKRRRYGQVEGSQRLWNFTLQNAPRIAVIAGLILFERIVYRYAYSFALGLELTLLKARHFMKSADRRQRCLSLISCYRFVVRMNLRLFHCRLLERWLL